MIANRDLNHRLSWWSYSILLAALATLPCLPTIGWAEKGKSAREVHGVVQTVDPAKHTVTVWTKKHGRATFELSKDIEVRLDDGTGQPSGFKKGKLTDLAEGLSVTLRLAKDKKVIRIKAEGPTVRGILKVADTVKGTVTVAVSLKKGAPAVERTFPVAKNAAIFISDGKVRDKSKPVKPTSLIDLPVETVVFLKLSFDRKMVGSIRAEGHRISGRVKAVDAAKNTISITITKKGEADVDRTYPVVKSASVSIDGGKPKDKSKPIKGRGIADVPVGARVTLRLSIDGKSVVAVHAHGANISGRVIATDTAKRTLTLQTKNKGKTIEKVEQTLPVGENVSIFIDGKVKGSKLGDVPVGAFVQLKLQADRKLVREIHAIGPTVMGRLVRDSVNFTLALGGKQGEKEYSVSDKVRIVIEGKMTGKLADLIEGTVARLRLSVDKSTVLEVHAEGPRYQGKVKAIDLDTQMITLTIGGKNGVGGKDREFKLSKSTVVIKQIFKTRLKLKDIQVGDHVVLRLSIDQKAAASLIVLGE